MVKVVGVYCHINRLALLHCFITEIIIISLRKDAYSVESTGRGSIKKSHLATSLNNLCSTLWSANNVQDIGQERLW